MKAYRLMVGITGLAHVTADSPEQAVALFKVAVAKAGIQVAHVNKPILNCSVTADVVKEIEIEDRPAADYVLKPHSIMVGQSTKVIQ